MPFATGDVLQRTVRLLEALLCTQARTRRNLTFFDLPRAVRDRVYRYALQDGIPLDTDWELDLKPHFPKKNLGLLCASRQIHEEATPILYEKVHLGSDAALAFKFLDFLGPDRVKLIQNLGLYYHCLQRCNWTGRGYYEDLDWTPVFERLWDLSAQFQSVDVSFVACIGDRHPRDHYLQTACLSTWDPESDSFWQGLQGLDVAKEIRLLDAVPEYFARMVARELGWHMQGEFKGGYDNPFKPLNTFKGILLNPEFMTNHEELQVRNPARNLGIRALRFAFGFLRHLMRGQPRAASTDGESLPAAARDANHQTTTHKRIQFLDLPQEIRDLIYEYACGEWVYKPFWPDRPAQWNPGFGLLLVSKQVSEEALPFIYRTVRIHGGEPLDDLDKLGQNLTHVRTLEIHFSCFCPFGGSNLRYNNRTLYAVREYSRALRSFPPWFGPGDSTPDAAALDEAKAAWSAAMVRIRPLAGLAELVVTFQSCCRSVSYQPRWRLSDIDTGLLNGTIAPHRRFCLLLEDHFLDLLTDCRRIERMSLLGNVPPSLAVRLARPYPECGMSLQAVSTTMAQFIKKTDEAWAAWNAGREHWPGMPWENSDPFPTDLEHPTLFPTPHFVLAREGTARGKWEAHVAAEEGGRLLAGMEVVAGPVSTMTLEAMRQFMDCDGKLNPPEVDDEE